MSQFTHVLQNIQRLKTEIQAIANRAGRNPADIRLIAVTKTYPVEAIIAAAQADILDAGENRIQEALPKIEALSTNPATTSLRWHLIGSLQTNKAKQAVQNFHLIHSVDSDRLARHINKHAANTGKKMPILIQVNVSGEQTKSGIAPHEIRTTLHQILDECNSLDIQGFMTMAPLGHPETARPVFRTLRELRDSLAKEIQHPNFNPKELSMGMSNDYTVAIEEGSTMIRIGTAIFGQRDYP